MTYCAQCGYALKDNTAICPACGVKNICSEGEIKPEIKPEACTEETVTLPEAETEAVYPIPQPVSEEKTGGALKTGYSDNAYPTGKYSPMSVGGYMVFSLLYMLPVLGLVIAAITAVATKKAAKKSFAVSAIILHLLAFLLIGGIVGISFAFGGNVVVATLQDLLSSIIK